MKTSMKKQTLFSAAKLAFDLVVPHDHACLWSQRLYVVIKVFGLVTRAIENSFDLHMQHNRAIRVLAGGASCSHFDV